MTKIILFQGDSITDTGRAKEPGKENNKGWGYANMVTGELTANEPYKYVCYNCGISGNRIVDLYARIKQDMINLKPDYMSILVGVNDALHEYQHQNGVSAEKYEMVYGLMIEELQKALPDLKIMILEPFILPGSATCNSEDRPGRWDFLSAEVSLRAAAAKRVASKYGLPFVPLQEMFNKVNADAPEMGYWLYDGVHPSQAGHTLIKRAWLKCYEENWK